MNSKFSFIILLLPLWGFAQDGEGVNPSDQTEKPEYSGRGADTLSAMLSDSVLDYREYLYWVENYHPVAQSARAVVDLAGMRLRTSRSGFDPMLYGNFDRKVYDDTDYYDKLQAGIEIPTWMGLSVVAGYEDNAGEYLNPERNVPTVWVDAVNTASVYLWGDGLTPIYIPPYAKPGLEDQEVSFADIPLQIGMSHPELQNLNFEKSKLNIERRLQEQNILPTVELKYNVLSENISPAPLDDYFEDTRFLNNNYKLGARVAFPIFTREARGKMGMANIQIDLREIEIENTREQLKARLDATLQKLSNVRDQIDFYTQNVEYLTRLLEGENELFSMGESSLFLVNSRETTLVEARNILYSLQAKERTLAAEARVIGGIGFFDE
ncbi:MAG: TolC family protein [Flavobacteriales bacterium]|nr:TolC family protein [Flavobacteriales bacterium]